MKSINKFYKSILVFNLVAIICTYTYFSFHPWLPNDCTQQNIFIKAFAKDVYKGTILEVIQKDDPRYKTQPILTVSPEIAIALSFEDARQHGYGEGYLEQQRENKIPPTAGFDTTESTVHAFQNRIGQQYYFFIGHTPGPGRPYIIDCQLTKTLSSFDKILIRFSSNIFAELIILLIVLVLALPLRHFLFKNRQ